MTVVTKVFISHRNSENSNQASARIEQALKAQGYEVFFDKTSLIPGKPWDDAIFDGIRTCEVLILVIEDSTSESNWVRREVDIARGLHVSILPVVVGMGDDNRTKETYEALHLENLQYMAFNVWKPDESAAKVADAVVPLIEATLENQTDAWNNWYTRREARQVIETTPQVEENPAYLRFTHPNIAGVTFQIATGDATRLRGYEVLVNSENTHMQMARFFERHTLSRQIRVRGAYTSGGRIKQDTIQEELFDQVKYCDEYGELPINKKQVVVTTAGHQTSELVKTGFRFILHAASVDLSDDELDIVPLHPKANTDIVENCLRRLSEIEQHQGRVLFNEDKQRYAPVSAGVPFQSVKSVLFPVFGAGQGGNAFEEAVSAIVQGFKRHTANARKNGMVVETIGLCVYDKRKVDKVKDIFLSEEMGFQLIGPTPESTLLLPAGE